MKGSVGAIVGKTIKAVLVNEHIEPSPPGCQVHLVFTDGSSYEFYSWTAIAGISALVPAGGLEAAKEYAGKFNGHIVIFE